MPINFSLKFLIITTRATFSQLKFNDKISLLVDDISADLDVADELSVIDYVSNTKNKQRNPLPEKQILSAQEEAQSKCYFRLIFDRFRIFCAC